MHYSAVQSHTNMKQSAQLQLSINSYLISCAEVTNRGPPITGRAFLSTELSYRAWHSWLEP